MPGMSKAELISALKKAKQRSMFFHFAGGKSEDKHYFAVSLKKLPPAGLMEAKKAAGNKAIGGTLTIDGKSAVFETVHPIPSKYELVLTKYLRSLKMAGMSVVIRGPDAEGAADEAGGEESGMPPEERAEKLEALREMEAEMDRLMSALDD